MQKWVVLLLVLVLYSCVSTSRKTEMPAGNQQNAEEVILESSGGGGPEYKGQIYAVQDRVLAKFKLAHIRGKFKSIMDLNDKGLSDVIIDQRISSFNDHLRWEVEYHVGETGDPSINGFSGGWL